MVNHIVGALIGAFILFMWQFASWSFLNIHGPQNQYTPNQDQVLSYLTQNLEAGEYFLPTVKPDASAEERQALTEKVIGKPWAKIQIHDRFEMTMGMNMLRGFVVNFLAVFIFCWIMLKIPQRDFMTVLLSALGIGMIGYLTVTYLNTVWFKGTSIPELIDAVVQWGICGAFLGWWLNR